MEKGLPRGGHSRCKGPEVEAPQGWGGGREVNWGNQRALCVSWKTRLRPGFCPEDAGKALEGFEQGADMIFETTPLPGLAFQAKSSTSGRGHFCGHPSSGRPDGGGRGQPPCLSPGVCLITSETSPRCRGRLPPTTLRVWWPRRLILWISSDHSLKWNSTGAGSSSPLMRREVWARTLVS